MHMFWGNPKIVHHNRLKPYHGLKRPPEYHRAFAEAKKNGPQLLSAVVSWGQRANPVFQSGQVCRQRGALPIKSLGVQGRQEGAPTVTGPMVTMQDGCTYPDWWGMSWATMD